MKLREHMSLCEKPHEVEAHSPISLTGWGKEPHGFQKGQGPLEGRGRLGQEYLSSCFIPHRHFTSFLSHTKLIVEVKKKKYPQAGQLPRLYLPAAMGPEDSAVDLRREPCCGGFCSWKKSSSGITRASVATNCRPAGRRERGQLQRQLCALSRLKPEAGCGASGKFWQP